MGEGHIFECVVIIKIINIMLKKHNSKSKKKIPKRKLPKSKKKKICKNRIIMYVKYRMYK